jgi:hypothetical protein
MLKKAAGHLNKESPESPPITWKVLDLDWSRQPYLVERHNIWHPKAAISLKGSILKGTFLGEEKLQERLTSVCAIKIVERSILYYDYGMVTA